MKNWFKSLSKTIRNTLCIAPLTVGVILIIIYAFYEKLILLILGICCVIVSLPFLFLNDKVTKEEKSKMSAENEAEHRRKMEASEKRGEADAALIQDSELDSAINELQKLNDEQEAYYQSISDPEKQRTAIYEFLYTNAKLKTIIKRKMKILRPDKQMSDGASDITIDVIRDVELPLYTKAVGVTFDNYQEHIKESKNGEALLIQHNPTERFPNSVDIINVRTKNSIGHIKSELADQLIDTFGQKFILNGEIAEITGGTSDRPNFGCNIRIISVAGELNK